MSGTLAESLNRALRPLRGVPERLAETDALSSVAGPVKDAVSKAVPPGSDLNTVLSGTWMGHPLHPLLTDVVIGAYTGAVVVDLVGGRRGQKSADRLLLLGLLAAAPTVASGFNDWSTLGTAEQRVGVVHAAGNAVGNVLFALSYVARKRKRRMRGRALAMAGLASSGFAGFLGGDLSFRRGAGVDRTSLQEAPSDWTVVADDASVAEGRPVLADADGVPVVLVRSGGQVRALMARCSHQGGPLHEGEVADGCITCPWHQSRFRLADGEAVSGPTAHPQPVLEVRVQGGKVEVRR
jgi:nitrite reductase/ring-hydroxylating ferredoxin subunit/uncharacterized membrane protein